MLVIGAVMACLVGPAGAVRSDSLVRLYEGGRTWVEFFEAAKDRKPMWTDNYQAGAPDSMIGDRARAVGGQWRILAVAEDWCGDSANTVPYLVRLAEQVPGLDIRIANSKDGRWLMERHQTPDGRAATPTIVLLDAAGEERGCIIERPLKLRVWVSENKPKLSDDDFQKAKMTWYREDRGRETVQEMVSLLEAAGKGPTTC